MLCRTAINIRVDAVANMSIDQDPEVLKIAASKFLGYSIAEIQETVAPVLEGNIREIISQVKLVDLIKGDKKVLAEKITENVSPNLRDMGLKLTTFNIQNFSDQNGVINNLGIENTEQIKKDASIAAARAKSEVAIAQAEAQKQANDAEIAAQTEIAVKQNELAIKKAELKEQQDIKLARAEAAKGIEAENQRKSKEIAEADANLARQEKQIELSVNLKLKSKRRQRRTSSLRNRKLTQSFIPNSVTPRLIDTVVSRMQRLRSLKQSKTPQQRKLRRRRSVSLRNKKLPL